MSSNTSRSSSSREKVKSSGGKKGSSKSDAKKTTQGNNNETQLMQQFQLFNQQMFAQMMNQPGASSPVVPMDYSPVHLHPTPNPAPPLSTSASGMNSMMMDDGGDSMFNKFGSFLQQMQQETQQTKEVYRQKHLELEQLKRSNEQLEAEVLDTRQAENQAAVVATELQNRVIELESLQETTLTESQTHQEMLRTLQAQYDAAIGRWHEQETSYEAKLSAATSSQQHQETQLESQARDFESHQAQWRDQVATLERENQLGREESQITLEALNAHAQTLETQKEELGKHIWRLSKELESNQHELAQKTAQNASWEEHMEAQAKAEQSARENLEAQVEALQHTLGETKESLKSTSDQLIEAQEHKEALNSSFRHKWEQMELSAAEERRAFIERQGQLEIQLTETRQALETSEHKVKTNQHELQEALEDLEESKRTSELQCQDQARVQRIAEESMAQVEALTAKCEQLSTHVSQSQDTLGKSEQHWQDWTSRLCTLVGSPTTTSVEHMLSIVQTWKQEREETFPTQLRARTDELEKVLADHKQLKQEHQTKAETLEKNLAQVKQDCHVLASTVKQTSLELEQVKQAKAESTATYVQTIEKIETEQLKRENVGQHQAKRVQELENDKRELLDEASQLNEENRALQTSLQDRTSVVQETQARLEQVQREATDFRDEIQSLNAIWQASQVDWKQAEAEYQTQHQASIAKTCELSQALAQQTDECAKAQETHAQLRTSYEQDKTRWTERCETLESQMGETSRENQALQVQVQTLGANLERTLERKNEDQVRGRQNLEALEQQLLTLGRDKHRLTCQVKTLESSVAQHQVDQTKSKVDKTNYQTSVHELEQDKLTLSAKMDALALELESAKERKAQQAREHERLAQEYQDVLTELETSRRTFRRELQSVQAQSSATCEELAEVRNQLQTAEREREEAQEQVSTVQHAANATIHELMEDQVGAQGRIEVERRDFGQELETYRSHVASLEREMHDRETLGQSALTALRETLKKLEASLEHKDAQLNVVKDRGVEMKKELDVMKKAVVDLESQKTEVGRNLSHARAELERQKETFQLTKVQLERKVSGYQEQEDTLVLEVQHLKHEKRTLERTLGQLRQQQQPHEQQSPSQDSNSTTSKHQVLAEAHVQQELRRVQVSLDRAKVERDERAQDLAECEQRLAQTQEAANATITDLSTRLHTSEAEKQMQWMTLSRDVALEKEKRERLELEVSQGRRRGLSRPSSKPRPTSSNLLTGETLELPNLNHHPSGHASWRYNSPEHDSVTSRSSKSTTNGGAISPVSSSARLESLEIIDTSSAAMLQAQISIDMSKTAHDLRDETNDTTTHEQRAKELFPDFTTTLEHVRGEEEPEKCTIDIPELNLDILSKPTSHQNHPPPSMSKKKTTRHKSKKTASASPYLDNTPPTSNQHKESSRKAAKFPSI